MLGAAQLRSGDMSAATESFQQAVDLAPDMAPFRNQLALSLLSAGEADQAIAQLSSAIDLDGDLQLFALQFEYAFKERFSLVAGPNTIELPTEGQQVGSAAPVSRTSWIRWDCMCFSRSP